MAEPHGDAAASGGRVQHELGEPGDLSASARLPAPVPAPQARPCSRLDEIQAGLEIRVVAVVGVRDSRTSSDGVWALG